MPVFRFILQRVFQAVLVTLAVTLFVAFAVRLTGDPAVMLTAESSSVTEDDLVRIRDALGLNQPFYAQYLDFIKSLVTFDLGNSFFRGSIRDLIGIALPSTLLLAVASMGISILISIPLGIHAALHNNSTRIGRDRNKTLSAQFITVHNDPAPDAVPRP